MAIPNISVRPNIASNGAAIDFSTASLSTPSDATLGASSVAPPATTQDLSSGGLFMGLLTLYGNEHPAEARAFLQGVASTLRSYSEQADPSLISLSQWADRFQQAAETGDLSLLTPRVTPAENLGLRAYQAALPAIDDPTEVLRSVPPPPDAATPNMLEALSQELIDLSSTGLETVQALASYPAAISGQDTIPSVISAGATRPSSDE